MISNRIKTTLLIFFIIFLIYTLFGNVYTYENLTNKDDKKTDDKNENSVDQCPVIELQGKEGPKGDQGPAGGIFIEHGPLRNLDQPNLVADRFSGSGPFANSYLSQRTYKPQQTWTLHSSQASDDLINKIENQYGGCMTVDDTNNIIMTNPIGCKDATKWTFTSQGTIVPANDRKKCLSYTNAGTIINLEKNGSINKNASKDLDKYGNLLKLNLVDCGGKSGAIPLSQQWVFS